MTKEKRDTNTTVEELLAKIDLSQEDKVRLIDEAVAEEYSENKAFMDTLKLSLEAFRGFYQLHTLYGNIDRRADKKFETALQKNIKKFQVEESLKRVK